MRIALTLFFLLYTAVSLHSQEVSIIPQPASLQTLNSSFELNPKTRVVIDREGELAGQYLTSYLKSYYHLHLKTVKGRSHHKNDKKAIKGLKKSRIILQIDAAYPDTVLGAYALKSEKDLITITSRTGQGLFYGIESLIQLLPLPADMAKGKSLTIPGVKVIDAPRFAYRGLMLDVGRHFMPVSFIKKFIDYLALHKMNNFHWHLTEDQGWRIQIKKYPLLTSVGAWRNGTVAGRHGKSMENDDKKTGGYYTQKEIKEVVRYATERYITVIPEIEMPGHSSAAIAAYPRLSCFPDSATETGTIKWSGPSTGKQVQQDWGVFKDVYAPTPYTFNFIKDVLDEVMALFPSKYIHIGGDECPKQYWKESAYCQQLIKQEGLKNEEGLQSYFIAKIEKYLNQKGRQIIGWDEILQGGLAPNATVQSWRGEKGGIKAAKMQHQVIMSPMFPLYLTRSQIKNDDSLTVGGYLPISKVYKYDPLGKMDEAARKYVIGAEGCLWTEYMKSPAKVEYMLFPRMSALSEVFWSRQENKNYDSFVDRLKVQVSRYKLWGINYCIKYTTK